MRLVDLKNDTLKYVMILRYVLEAVDADPKDSESRNAILDETNRFLNEFSKDFMNQPYREHTHKIIYSFAQILTERIPKSTQFIKLLLVSVE